jgi:hypothetical protein
MHSTTSSSINQLIGRLALAVMPALLVTSVTPVFAQLAITCPADITVSNDQGLCSAVVDYPAPIVTGSVGDTVVTCIPDSGSAFPVGTNEVICAATDSVTNQASCSFTITVEDTEPPVITDVSVSKSMLWPPNHKLVKVAVNYQDSDNCDSSPICTLSVTSNEAEDGRGDGHTSQDWKVLNAHMVKLRAERSGQGDGRIYTITITCTDENGNAASEDVTVLVPHSRGRGAGSQGNNRGDNGIGKGHHLGNGRAHGS